jgi:hypothetical protein
MEKDINLYELLKETVRLDGVSDEEFMEWYQDEITKNYVLLNKSLMENPHIRSNPKNTLKWAINNAEDGFEYIIKVSRFKKFSIANITNKIDNFMRKIVHYFRTLDD